VAKGLALSADIASAAIAGAVGVVGVVGTLTASLTTNRSNQRLEKERQERDEARALFNDRRAVYAQYLQCVQTYTVQRIDAPAGYQFRASDLESLFHARSVIDLVGSVEVRLKARAIWDLLDRSGNINWDELGDLRHAFVEAGRIELLPSRPVSAA
jgi:hypothetical protein